MLQIFYTIIHTLVYMFVLSGWDDGNVTFVLLYFMEELPNFYCMLAVLCYYLDNYLPQYLVKDYGVLQKVIYNWKPMVQIFSYITLFVQMIPLCVGAYLWYFKDGQEDAQIGEMTFMQSLSALLPYACSLIMMYVALDLIKGDFGLAFAANPNAHQHPRVLASADTVTESVTPEASSSDNDDTPMEDLQRQPFDVNTLVITKL